MELSESSDLAEFTFIIDTSHGVLDIASHLDWVGNSELLDPRIFLLLSVDLLLLVLCLEGLDLLYKLSLGHLCLLLQFLLSLSELLVLKSNGRLALVVLRSLALFLFGFADIILLGQLLEKCEDLVLLNGAILVGVQFVKGFIENLLCPLDFLPQLIEALDHKLLGLITVK